MQKVDPDELRTGITNAHSLLVDGGAFVLRVPCPPDDQGQRRQPFFAMLEAAYEAGFTLENTHRYGSAVSGLLPDGSYRGYLCAVLTKG